MAKLVPIKDYLINSTIIENTINSIDNTIKSINGNKIIECCGDCPHLTGLMKDDLRSYLYCIHAGRYINTNVRGYGRNPKLTGIAEFCLLEEHVQEL